MMQIERKAEGKKKLGQRTYDLLKMQAQPAMGEEEKVDGVPIFLIGPNTYLNEEGEVLYGQGNLKNYISQKKEEGYTYGGEISLSFSADGWTKTKTTPDGKLQITSSSTYGGDKGNGNTGVSTTASTVLQATLIPGSSFTFTFGTKAGKALSMGGGFSQMNYSAQRAAASELQAAIKLAKPIMKGITVLNVASTITQAGGDFMDGHTARGWTRLGVGAGIIGLTILCPPVGIICGLGEAFGGDYIYNKIK